MAADSAIPRIGLVGNRVTGPEQERIIRTFAGIHGVPVLTMVPYDQQVLDSGITGASLPEEDCPALAAIAHLADLIREPAPVSTGLR
jgi:CO dehydrogenase nickel-insertion accessory protein CooC1